MKNLFFVLVAMMTIQTVNASDFVMLRKSSDQTLERAATLFKNNCEFLIGEATSINYCQVVRASVSDSSPSSETLRKIVKQFVYRTHSGFVLREVDATSMAKDDVKMSAYLQEMVDETIDLSYSENEEEILKHFAQFPQIASIALSSDATELHQVLIVHDHGVGKVLSFYNRKTHEIVLFSIISSE